MKRIEWVIPRSQLRALLAQGFRTSGSDASPTLRLGVGISTGPDHLELITRAKNAGHQLALIFQKRSDAIAPPGPPAGCIGMVTIGQGVEHGRIARSCDVGLGLQPIDTLRPVGAGMHRIRLDGANYASDAHPAEDPDRLERWSRTIGALGLHAWQRLTRLHFAVVGATTLAENLKHALVRIGARRITHVTRTLGDAKGAINAAVREAARPCEMIALTSETPEIRVAAATMAARYGKPLLDIFLESSSARIALILPGQGHCAHCAGDNAGSSNIPPRSNGPSFIDDLALGIGLRMVEDLIVESIQTSLVAEVSFGADGRLVVDHRPIVGRSGCAVCATAGMGDMQT